MWVPVNCKAGSRRLSWAVAQKREHLSMKRKLVKVKVRQMLMVMRRTNQKLHLPLKESLQSISMKSIHLTRSPLWCAWRFPRCLWSLRWMTMATRSLRSLMSLNWRTFLSRTNVSKSLQSKKTNRFGSLTTWYRRLYVKRFLQNSAHRTKNLTTWIPKTLISDLKRKLTNSKRSCSNF